MNWYIRITMLLSVAYANVASSQTPDTLDWRRYFPLEVGNQWQYRSEDFGFVYFTRWFIRTDTLLEGQRYFVVEIEALDSDFRPLEQARRTDVIRYDTANAFVGERVMYMGSPADVWWLDIPCALDAPFGARVECTGTVSRMEYVVDGDYRSDYVIGTETVEVAAVKYFDSLGGIWTLVADIGLGYRVVEGGSPVTELVYANVNGKSYGEAPVPTAVGEAKMLASPVEILSIYPSPFTARTTVVYQVSAPGRVDVEVFNVLGQRVMRYAVDAFGDGTNRTVVEGRGLAPGIYIVRLVSPHGVQDSRPVALIR